MVPRTVGQNREVNSYEGDRSEVDRDVERTIGQGEVCVRADEGALFIYSAGSKAVLAVLSPQDGNAGLIHLEARAAAKQIGDLF